MDGSEADLPLWGTHTSLKKSDSSPACDSSSDH